MIVIGLTLPESASNAGGGGVPAGAILDNTGDAITDNAAATITENA